MRRKEVEGLFPDLESGDAFTRLEAEKRLRGILSRDFGFRWDGAEGERAAAVARLRAWLAEAVRREKGRGQKFPGLAAVDLNALKGLSPEEIERHLQALLGKAQALAAATAPERQRCESCGKRQATVEIVEVRGRRARGVTRLCDSCASQKR